MERDDLELLTDALRKTMLTASGQRLDAALAELGWRDMLDEMPETAIPLVFGLLGETGAHAPVINDVVLREVLGYDDARLDALRSSGALG